MERFALALLAISLGGAFLVSTVVGVVRRRQADRAQRLFLALAQELKLQVDFSARWNEMPLPIGTGNLEGASVRVESRLHRAKLPWHILTHVEATRRDKLGPVGTIGQPPRIRPPAGATERTLSDDRGRTVKLCTTEVDLLVDALDADMIHDLVDLCGPGRGLVLHPDRVEFIDAPLTSDTQRRVVERVARVAGRLAKRLASRPPKSRVE